MSKRFVKTLLLFAFFALFGFFLQVEKPHSSSDEKDDFALVESFDEPDSEDELAPACFVFADGSILSNNYSSKVIRLSHSADTDNVYSRLYSLMNGWQSQVFSSRARHLLKIGVCISSYRYLAGYYIYQLCRLLI